MRVDAGRLLKELDESWRQMGKAQDHGTLRACSMTFLVVVREDEDPQSLGATIAEIMHEYPSRAIVLRVGSGDALEARTSIQCWMPFGRRQQVCCEQIELLCGRDALDAAVPVLLGLMVADLPVALWCGDLELAVLAPLRPVLALAGKVIVDSACCADVTRAIACLKPLSAGPWRLADLTWTRITRWRETAAQLARTCGLPKSCEVTYAGPGTAPAAAYLASWCRLALACDVRLRSESPQLPPPGIGRLRSLVLEEACGLASLRRTEKTALSVQAGCVQSTVVFPLHTPALLLRGELGVFGADSHFEAALASLENFL